MHVWLRPVAFAAILATAGLFAAPPATAQNAGDGQLALRVQDLEQSVRDLTGQVQGLQFTLTQMQQQMQKMQDDYEFRLQQLEGGKKPGTAPSTGKAPAGAVPAKPPSSPAAPSSLPPPAPLSSGTDASDQPADGLGDSQDPLLGTGGTETSATLGTLPAGSDGKALNLSLDSSQPISNGDAEAQYKAGYDAIVRGDYAFAEDQFRQFVALYPDDPQAADATNWLGEALLQRQAYDEAADVLLTGYQKYQDSPRAPDLLFKLGIAMAGAGEQDVACRTFFKLKELYPKQPAAFTQRVEAEKKKAKCPV